MDDVIILYSTDPIIQQLTFKPYRSTVERRVVRFEPPPGVLQQPIKTPWGETLTAELGDYLVSELNAPDDIWPINKEIFEETYVETRPGFCAKRALTYLAPLVDLTGGDPDQMVTVHSMEGAETVRAGDFYLARGTRGEIWTFPREKVHRVLAPLDY